jgi:hypothetical protein
VSSTFDPPSAAGVGVNATSITPITALQYGADTALMDMVIKYNKALGAL